MVVSGWCRRGRHRRRIDHHLVGTSETHCANSSDEGRADCLLAFSCTSAQTITCIICSLEIERRAGATYVTAPSPLIPANEEKVAVYRMAAAANGKNAQPCHWFVINDRLSWPNC